MKKYLFLLIAAFVCSSVNAQLVTTSSYTKKKKQKATWYVKAGANIANTSMDDVDLSSIFGYHIGIAFDKPIGSKGVFWSLGLQLATKGWKYSEDDDGWDYEEKLNVNKIEIPLTFGYKYAINDDITVEARVGAFANYDLWGKLTEEDNGDKEEYDLGDLDDYYGYDRFSAGIVAGVGVWYQKFNFNITYERGFVEQNDGKEKTWMIGVGYAF